MTACSRDADQGDGRADGAAATGLLSVVVPCFNEAEVIAQTHRRLLDVLVEGAGMPFEILYVDDGSRDATLERLRLIQAAEPRVGVIGLSRNFGHQIAVTAGLEAARGDAVVLIDADLQDPPEVILAMLARWREGVDVAYGVRTDRAGESAFKLLSAKLFYRAIRGLSDTEIPLDTGDFRLMDRKVVDALLRMPERDRFIRGMVAWLAFAKSRFIIGGPRASRARPSIRSRRCCASPPMRSFHSRSGRCSWRSTWLHRVWIGPARHPLRARPATLHRDLGDWLDAAVHRRALSWRGPVDLSRNHRRVPRACLWRGQAPASLSGE